MEERKKEKREEEKIIDIGLIRVGIHSGWMFSGLMAF
jgi:hypothetical protein